MNGRIGKTAALILFSVLLPTRLNLLPDKTDILVDYECCWLFLVELRKLLNYIYVNCNLNLNRGNKQDSELHFKLEHKEVKV